MASDDFENGVWRTIGGRHIFIRDGESVSSAMKRSGKFKSAKKKEQRKFEDVDKEFHEHAQKMEKNYEEFGGNSVEDERKLNELSRERDKALLNKDKNNRVRTLSGEYEKDNKGREVTQEEYDRFREAYKNDKISKEDYISDNYDALKSKNEEQIDETIYAENLKEAKNGYDKLAIEYKNLDEEMANANSERLNLYEHGSWDEAYENLYGKLPEKNAKNTLSPKDYKKYEELTKRYHENRRKSIELDKKIEKYKKEHPEEYKESLARYKEIREEYDKDNVSGWDVLDYQQKMSKKLGRDVSTAEAYDAVKARNLAKYQQSKIEKASGLKVKNAFESDLYSNGKEDRFELEDGRWIAHTKESFGKKDDTWTVNKLENGKTQSQKYDSYDDMIKHLGSSSNKNIWEKEDATEIYNHLTKSEQNKMRQAYEDLDFYEKGTPAYKNAEDYIKKMDDKAVKKFSQSNNNAYKKAFQEYKKAHPNSKLTLQKFIDMSEGK